MLGDKLTLGLVDGLIDGDNEELGDTDSDMLGLMLGDIDGDKLMAIIFYIL